MQNISRLYDHAVKSMVQTVATHPNPLLAAILSRGQAEPISTLDLQQWWLVLLEQGYRPNTLAAAAFIIGARHGKCNDASAPWFVRWTAEQAEAAERGWIYGRMLAGRPVLCPVIQFTADPRLQLA